MEIQLSGNIRDVAGVASLNIEATSVGELLRKAGERYPKLEPMLTEVAVSINGQIFRDDWNQPIPADAEVFLLPRIPGG